MAKEIERKFIVSEKSFVDGLTDGVKICQAYLSTNPDATVRIRIFGDIAFLTVKSRNRGAERGEWEYEIPMADAVEMMDQCSVSDMIEKTRYKVDRWEIDVFEGALSGLVLAEIELSDVNEPVTLPNFIGKEVTDDPRFYNSHLASVCDLPKLFL